MYSKVANPQIFTSNCCKNCNHLLDPEFWSKLCSRNCRTLFRPCAHLAHWL